MDPSQMHNTPPPGFGIPPAGRNQQHASNLEQVDLPAGTTGRVMLTSPAPLPRVIIEVNAFSVNVPPVLQHPYQTTLSYRGLPPMVMPQTSVVQRATNHTVCTESVRPVQREVDKQKKKVTETPPYRPPVPFPHRLAENPTQ